MGRLSTHLKSKHWPVKLSGRNTAELGVQDAYIFSDFIRIFCMCIVSIYTYVQLKNILLFQLLLFLLGGGGVWVLLLSAFSMTSCIWKLLLFYIIECNFKSKSSMILYEYFLSDEKKHRWLTVPLLLFCWGVIEFSCMLISKEV